MVIAHYEHEIGGYHGGTTSMPTPSLNELLDRVPLGSAAAGEHLSNTFATRADADEPVSIPVLLDLLYDLTFDDLEDDDCEEIRMWCERALRIGLAQLFETENIDSIAWCARAVRCSWGFWKATIVNAVTHDAVMVERIVDAATALSSSREQLESALRDYTSQPSHTSPPPYIGHFYGGLDELLHGRLDHERERLDHVASCLSFACVMPDGSRRAADIAAAAA
jgi:hypothetical protein